MPDRRFKLTPEQKLEVMRICLTKEMTQIEAATLYNISPSYVSALAAKARAELALKSDRHDHERSFAKLNVG